MSSHKVMTPCYWLKKYRATNKCVKADSSPRQHWFVIENIFTGRIRRRGKVLFSQVSLCPHPGGTPSPSHNTSFGPISFPERGTQDRDPPLPSQVRMGATPGQFTPPSRDGVPPPPPRTAEGVLATRRAVCLLRSRRRTFFLCN